MAKIGNDYYDKLATLRADKLPGGFNGSLCGIIRLARSCGLKDEQIREDIIANMPGRVQGREAEIDRALENTKTENKRHKQSREEKEEVSIETTPVDLPDGINDAAACEAFLTTVFRFDDPVTICPGRLNAQKEKSEPDNEKRETRTVEEWIELFAETGGPSGYWPQTKKPNHGCFVIVNPGKGAELNEITRFENFLVECDSGSKEGQLGAIRAMGLPIVTLVDSGGKSIHAIVRTEKARGAEALKNIAKRVYAVFGHYEIDGAPPGLDVGNCSANRYTRLPGSWRGDKMQSLLSYSEDPVSVDDWLPDAEDQITLAELPDVDSAEDYAEQDPPEHDPVIAGLFDVGDKVAIIASSKGRKSFFAKQLALSIAAAREGQTFMKWPVAKPRKVLYVNFELKATSMRRRVHRMCIAMGIQPHEIRSRLVVANLRGFNVEPKHLLALARKHKAEIMICDPLYKLGDGDELAADLKPLMRMFDRIYRETGTGIIYVHHNPKGIAGDRKTIDRGSGSGVLARDYDCGIYIDDHQSGNELRVLSIVARDYPPNKEISIVWSEGCFIESDEIPVIETSRNRSRAKVDVEPADILQQLKKKGPMHKMEFDRMIYEMIMSREKQRILSARLIDEGQVATYKEPGRGKPIWCGTPEQIDNKSRELRQATFKIEGKNQ